MAYSQVQKIESEVDIKTSADKLYDVFCNRPHYIATISPQKVQSVQIQNGEWGTEGSVITWNYVHEGKICVAKEIVEDIDKENKKLSFNVVEGDLLGHYKTFKANLQATPKGKGSVIQWTIEFEKQHNHIPDPHAMLQLGIQLTKDIDSYLTKDHN